MKILVCGYGGHGKDTFCEKLGMTFGSSSKVALDEVIWPVMKDRYSSKEECFVDRRNNRQEWFDLISEYNKDMPTRLAEVIFSRYNIYCGMRSRREFKACRHRKVFDVAIWVDSTIRLGRGDDCEIGPLDCDFVVNNNGTITDLCKQAMVVKHALYSPVRSVIVNWADEVFPDRTITNALTKMVMEEIPEYMMAQNDPLELADIAILLYDVAHLAGVDLDSAIRRKMLHNYQRHWDVDEVTGLMSHV